MWPAFAVVTLAEAFMFEALPFSGDGPGGFVASLLLAAGLNLVVVAALAPVAGMLLRRRRPDLPRAIAADHCGTALLVTLFACLLAAGIVNRSAVRRDARDLSASYVAASRYVHAQAPAYADTLGAMDAVRVEVGMWRACVPGPDPSRPLCLYVNTDQDPPGVTRDPERIPNALWRR